MGDVNVTGMKAAGQKKLMLFSGRTHPDLAAEVAVELGIETVPTRFQDFANGEIFVRYLESVRGCDAFVIQCHSDPINKSIMEQLIMVDALKRASAKRITVVTPFFGYARQDKKHRGREPISARLITDLFKAAGADRLMAVDLHTDQIQGFFDGPVDHLFALPLLADYVAANVDLSNTTVVSPDSGRVRTADRWADRLGTPLCPGGRHDRHRGDHREGRGRLVRAGGSQGDRGRDARCAVGARRGPAQGLADFRGRHHQLAAGVEGPAVRQADPAIDRSTAGSGDQRGVQRRFSDEPVRVIERAGWSADS
jgi:hypothetical protein